MSSKNTSKQSPKTKAVKSAHKEFSWLNDEVKYLPLTDFVALTMDMSQGINTCLNLIFASELERTFNQDADPGDEITPAIDEVDADRLLRLSIAATKLLANAAEKNISWINTHGASVLGASGKGGRVMKASNSQLVLTPAELRMLMNFREVDASRRRVISTFISYQADKAREAKASVPALRLVKGGAQ